MESELANGGEILLYSNGEDKEYVSVIFAEENFWLSQNGMAELFGCTSENIIQHLKNIFAEEELELAATAKKFLVVRREGSRDVRRSIDHYNLDAIIAVGYRVNSKKVPVADNIGAVGAILPCNDRFCQASGPGMIHKDCSRSREQSFRLTAADRITCRRLPPLERKERKQISPRGTGQYSVPQPLR